MTHYTLGEVPNYAYQKMPGISATFLKAMRRSPAHAKLASEDNQNTKDRVWYNLTHCAILEPHRLDTDYVLIPRNALRRLPKSIEEYKNVTDEIRDSYQYWKSFDSKNEGKIQISQEDMDAALHIRDNAMKLRCVTELLSGAKFEISAFAIDPITGLKIRARADVLRNKMIVDIKNCTDARVHAFNKQIGAMGYHLQMAHYRETFREADGNDRPWAAFIAIEDKAPYGIQCHPMDEAWMDQGIKERRELLLKVKECQERNVWPVYPDEMTMCKKPVWYGTLEEVFYSPE
jgi:PDDEXK-like domain of unknown function (DUF3799)